MKNALNQTEIFRMKKKIINTLNSPSPIGPYNQAIFTDNTLYISGQIALNPKTMKLVNESIKDETNQVMNNLKNILDECNMDFSNVVKSSIFLSDMNLFQEVNSVYGEYFDKGNEPARETLAVKTLPLNVRLEISMIAVK